MSHNKHVFLVNMADSINDAMKIVDNTLLNNPPECCDSFAVCGAIDLYTNAYAEYKYTLCDISNEIRSKNDLEKFANGLYSQALWDCYKTNLERFVKSDLFWEAKCTCKLLDGISYAKSLGFPKWSAEPDKAFAINDSYYDLSGVTDWRTINGESEADYEPEKVYAVIVDFHS